MHTRARASRRRRDAEKTTTAPRWHRGECRGTRKGENPKARVTNKHLGVVHVEAGRRDEPRDDLGVAVRRRDDEAREAPVARLLAVAAARDRAHTHKHYRSPSPPYRRSRDRLTQNALTLVCLFPASATSHSDRERRASGRGGWGVAACGARGRHNAMTLLLSSASLGG